MADYSRERHGRSEYAEDSDTRINLDSGRMFNVEESDEYSLGRQIAALSQEMGMIDEAITLAAKRLGPLVVDRNMGMKAPGEEGPARDQNSPVIEEVIGLRAHVRNQHTRLMSLIHSVQI